jgi:2-polyprenyl-3-methyl-5-hydroxy-6-metoxy-1,4-benzoquinol methylase
MPCNCCEITDQTFNEKDAKADMKAYRRRGPAEQTRLILNAVRSLGLKDMTLLDIGGGVGAIHHELLEDMAREATHVDASSAYLTEAKAEAARRGHAEQVNFIHADFTDVAADVPQADVVTLDRVVCCYPDFRGLLKAAAGRSQRALALTYPRETWYLKFSFNIANIFQRIGRGQFRIFLHPVAEMDFLLNKQGFERVFMQRLMIWEAALYKRV